MTATIDEDTSPIDALEIVRERCLALRNIFLPDHIWAEFREWHRQSDTTAWHCSKLILALQRGCLGGLTGPIHRYLMSGNVLRSDVRRQYLKDLPERWMLNPDPLERHRRSRRHDGRLAELQFAEWLEKRSWQIIGLEALQQGPDIEAELGTGAATAFEVKSIGTEDVDFSMIVRSMSKGPSAHTVSPYAAINYLLYRVYEASKQLARYNRRRIAVIMIEDLAWSRFQIQLQNNWINWNNPEFCRGDHEWEAFINQKDMPVLKTELRSLLGTDGIWIVRRTSDYESHLEYEVCA